MPSMKEINDLAVEMHNKKIINLDISARDVLSAASVHRKGEEVGIYALGGDHYVIVCGSTAGNATNPVNITRNK
ncbi:hypothetical protein [Simplicispira psychrophila]|uniref:hypothetical protein n=1 Tax=Simplicispira psychrophila TaxID=80882 RepID=UPI0012EC1D48|nr:hypothetical protein [Simplicispira psychrophila]